MAAATTVKNGENVSSTATEIQLLLTRPYDDHLQYVRIELVSGSVQFGVYADETAFTPRITTERTFSTAGDKAVFTVENGKYNLRCKGVGVFTITW